MAAAHIVNTTSRLQKPNVNVIDLSPKAIAYEITHPSLRRKPESIRRQTLDYRNKTNDLRHRIPAFAGMTVVKQPICDSPVCPQQEF